jgi:transposase
MSYSFRPYEQDQMYLMPPSLRDWVAEGSLARFVSDVVDRLASEDRLAGFYALYREDGVGNPPYHPVMMVRSCCSRTRTGCRARARSRRRWSRTWVSASWRRTRRRTSGR